MGGRAHSLTIGLGVPPDLPAQWTLDFARGFADECALVGATVVGGDLTSADSIVIAVTVIHKRTYRHPTDPVSPGAAAGSAATH